MRVTLRAVLMLAWVVALILLVAAAVWPYLDEPDPRTWPRIPWPATTTNDGGAR